MHGPINIKRNEYTFKLFSKYSFDFSNYNILWWSGYLSTSGKFNKIKLYIGCVLQGNVIIVTYNSNNFR